MTRTDLTSHRLLITVLVGIGVVLGVAVAVFTSDAILGVLAGAGFIASIQPAELPDGGSPIARPGHRAGTHG
jgi:hypothetical protein